MHFSLINLLSAVNTILTYPFNLAYSKYKSLLDSIYELLINSFLTAAAKKEYIKKL